MSPNCMCHLVLLVKVIFSIHNISSSGKKQSQLFGFRSQVAFICCVAELSFMFFSQLYCESWCYQRFITNWCTSCFKRILKFTWKQFLHVSVHSPSSGNVLFELAKVIVIKIISSTTSQTNSSWAAPCTRTPSFVTQGITL